MRVLNIWLGCTLCMAMASCTSYVKDGNGDIETIPVASAYAGGMKQLKVSDILSCIRYVALETNDSVLVGRNPKVTLLADGILVTDEKQALLFDREDGSFLCKIGHQGNDPHGYSSSKSHFVGKDGDLYISAWKSDKWQRYGTDGKYKGVLSFSEQDISTSSFVLPLDEGFVKYYNIILATGQEGLSFYAPDGKPTGDTIAIGSGGKCFQMVNISQVAVFNPERNHLVEDGAFILYMKGDDTPYVTITNPPVLWEEDGEVRAMMYRNDTVYTVAKGLEPKYCFDMGEWSASLQDKGSDKETLILGKVNELENTILFECFKSIYSDDTFYGVYNRKTGAVSLGHMNDKLYDDITPFMPVDFSMRTANHELAGLLDPVDVLEWADEHNECCDNPSLAFVKTLKEDDNPVVVIATE